MLDLLDPSHWCLSTGAKSHSPLRIVLIYAFSFADLAKERNQTLAGKDDVGTHTVHNHALQTHHFAFVCHIISFLIL